MAKQAKLSILIVDDSDVEREALKRILEPIYDVITAKSGEIALKKAVSEKPDIILTDIVMPNLNGFDVLTRLKELDETRDIPVLCITGLNNVEDEERGLFLGAVDYITKPYNDAIVKARIKTHMQIVKHIRTIEQLGMIDVLTGLPNMRHFDYKLQTEWARGVRKGTPVSVISIDIDGFKLFNEQYGHPKGDELLQEIAKAILSTYKKLAYLSAHLGADEFAVLMPNSNLDSAYELAKDIREAISEIELFTDKRQRIPASTVCIGTACMQPAADNKASELITKADKALFKAKSEGINSISD